MQSVASAVPTVLVLLLIYLVPVVTVVVPFHFACERQLPVVVVVDILPVVSRTLSAGQYAALFWALNSALVELVKFIIKKRDSHILFKNVMWHCVISFLLPVQCNL